MTTVLLLFIVGCTNNAANETNKATPEEESGTRIIVDSVNREVEIPEHVERIICSGVGVLRYTSYMGAQDLVIGVEDYEKEQSHSRPYNYVNFDHFESLPIIGANGELYVEEAISVNPDVIVLNSQEKSEADDIQAKTNIPVVVVPGSDKMMDENAYQTITLMGELYGKEERSKELIAYFDDVKADLEDRTKDTKEAEKPTVYVGGVNFRGSHGIDGTEAGYGPLAWINAKNLADETGENGPFNVDVEKILEWDPDVLFLNDGGLELIHEHNEANPAFYEQLQAVQNNQIFSQISYRSYATNLDMALINTYYAGTVLYPETFADIDPVEKADDIFTKLLGTDFYHVLQENGYELKPIKIGETMKVGE